MLSCAELCYWIKLIYYHEVLFNKNATLERMANNRYVDASFLAVENPVDDPAVGIINP